MDYYGNYEQEDLEHLRHYDKWSIFNGIIVTVISGVVFGLGHGLTTGIINKKLKEIIN